MNSPRHPRGPARSLPRAAPLALLTAALLASAGCHKSQVDVYAPPPPDLPAPTQRASPRAAPRSAATSPRTHSPSAAQTPAGPLIAAGAPISTEIGLASWYGPPYHNHPAADGSIFDQNALTAAHRTLPLGTVVRVTNVASGQAVLVRITDRGPFVQGRTLDLSLAAAKAIGVYRAGVAEVKVEAFANPTASPTGRWCVQVGVFIDPADALQTKNDLAMRFRSAKVIEFAGPTGHWVRVNPAQPDRATAAHIAESIHLPDADPYLIRTD